MTRLVSALLGALLVATGCGSSSPSSADLAGDLSADLKVDSAFDAGADAAVEAGQADAATTPQDHAALLWQGYDHAWLRTVLGFRIPHRISRFDSFIDGEQWTSDAAGPRGAARFHFGQGTGVDGNYMKPVGYHQALSAPGLAVWRGEHKLTFTDQIVGDPPRAESTHDVTLEIDLARPALAFGSLADYLIVLRGIALTTHCDDAKQPVGEPCNSDGLWPYRFFVGFEACQRAGQKLRCPLKVQLHRAWTPNKGGLPGIAEKPLNARLGIELRVLYTVLGANAQSARFTRGALVGGSGRGHDAQPFQLAGQLAGDGGGVYQGAALGLRAFGFTLSPASADASQQHLGRYIGAWRFSARPGSYDAESGQAAVDYTAQVWLPDTVVDSNVAYELRAALIQLGGSGQVFAAGQAEGSLCSNSSDQAPLFSVWKKCGEPDKGPEQTRDDVPIQTP